MQYINKYIDYFTSTETSLLSNNKISYIDYEKIKYFCKYNVLTKST